MVARAAGVVQLASEKNASEGLLEPKVTVVSASAGEGLSNMSRVSTFTAPEHTPAVAIRPGPLKPSFTGVPVVMVCACVALPSSVQLAVRLGAPMRESLMKNVAALAPLPTVTWLTAVMQLASE